MKEAGVAPPGVMPIQQPIRHERSEVTQYWGNFAQVCNTIFGFIFPLASLNARPSSIVIRISPIPKSPITAIRKSNPCSMSVNPKVIRNVPVTVSSPTAASAKPSIIDAIVLSGGSRPIPTKLQNVNNWTPKYSGGPNLSANLATSGARKVIMMTATSAPTNEDVNAAVIASPARPFCAMG
jgi:hypothetical protein